MKSDPYGLLERHADILSAPNDSDSLPLLITGELPQQTDWLTDDIRRHLRVATWNLQVAEFFGQQLPSNDEIFFGCPTQFPERTARCLLVWPKSKHLAQSLIRWLHQFQTETYVLGANELGGKSVGKHVQPTANAEKIDSARRSSLWQLNWKNDPQRSTSHFNWLAESDSFRYGHSNYITLPGVFNCGALDDGTALLLGELPDLKGTTLLDLGCGSGVIGLSLKQRYPSLNVVLSDLDAMAIRSTQLNAARLQLDVSVLASDCLRGIQGRFDHIITNPPFHSGKNRDFGFAQALFSQGKRHLTSRGKIWVVANRQLPYEGWAQDHFEVVDILSQSNGFKVICLSNPKVESSGSSANPLR